MEKIEILSKVDKTLQPSRIQSACGSEKRPLLVALHTWSYTFDSFCDDYAELCRKKNWHLIYPNFRGPNCTPAGCGSDLAVSDIEDAVEYMRKNYPVDDDHIYLMGGSGGGHFSLLVAGRRPDLFTAISAWCPISDIARWYGESLERGNRYAEHIELACSGNPQSDPAAMLQAQLRSPLSWLNNAVNKVPVDISTGIHDGHTGSVPIGQAVRAYNMLAAESDRISEADLEFMEKNEKIPAHLAAENSDPAYGNYTVYLRKSSNMVRLTLFEGGHNIFPEIGGNWLERQSRGGKVDFSDGEALQTKAVELSK